MTKLPDNTNTLDSLTVAEAEKLVDRGADIDLGGLKRLTADVAAILADSSRRLVPCELDEDEMVERGGHIVLSGLTDLPEDVAAALAKASFRVTLILDGLSTLSPAAATALSHLEGSISLGGLTTLTPSLADVLALSSYRMLHLDGLTHLTPEDAGALAGFTSALHLNGLLSLSADSITALAALDGLLLSLDGLTRLSPDEAKALAKYRGELSLCGLSTLPPDVAKALGRHCGPDLFEGMHLDGVTSLAPDSASAFRKYRTSLSFRGLREIDDESLSHLMNIGGALYIEGVTKLSDKAITAVLASQMWRDGYLHPGEIVSARLRAVEEQRAAEKQSKRTLPTNLSDLETITVKQAQALAKRKKRDNWHFSKVTELSAAVAEILFDCPAETPDDSYYMSLGITHLPEDVAAHLAKFPGSLVLERLETLSPAAATLITSRTKSLRLGITTLSPETAERLSHYKGCLYFTGLRHLEAESARPFARFTGNVLEFTALEELLPDAAKHLAQSTATLMLNAVKDIGPETARHLGTHRGTHLGLSGLVTLSAAAADSLSHYHGYLPLYGLTHLSPEAALSLSQCKRVEVSDEVRSLLTTPSANNPRRVASASPDGKYPSLVEAHTKGATTLRTIWQGHGDDGCFEHVFLAAGVRVNPEIDPDSDVTRIIETQQLRVDGRHNGTVGILEIDLKDGQATFWDGQEAGETQRFAEFVLACEWAAVTELTATLDASVKDDNGDGDEVPLPDRIAIDGTITVPAGRDAAIVPTLQTLLDRIVRLEYGDDLIRQVVSKCGTRLQLHVDVAGRTFVFSGGGKKVTAKVPKKALTITRFHVEL